MVALRLDSGRVAVLGLLTLGACNEADYLVEVHASKSAGSVQEGEPLPGVEVVSYLVDPYCDGPSDPRDCEPKSEVDRGKTGDDGRVWLTLPERDEVYQFEFSHRDDASECRWWCIAQTEVERRRSKGTLPAFCDTDPG